MTIHKEGYGTILFTAILLLLLNFGLHFLIREKQSISTGVITASTLFFLSVLSFFRSPKRKTESREGYVLSPADGKVVAIEEVTDTEYFNDKRLQISVFMSPINVHINWYPVSGQVSYFKHHNGHFHVAWHPKSSHENERTSTVLKQTDGKEILFRQIAGAVARRIVSYATLDQGAEQGRECGFIKFGSRVDVLLPLDTDLEVKIGDKVTGGLSVLAKLQ